MAYDPRYHQQPYQRHPRVTKSVHKERGLGGCQHSTHLILTVCTCGVWGIVWFTWWVIRMIVPKRHTTRHYHR